MVGRQGGFRPGITLLEVLTAIFIMGVGLMALLTLYPLGALSMAQAVRNDRAAAIAVAASANASAMNLHLDPLVAAQLGAAPGGVPGPDPTGSGYAVLVDPTGALTQPTFGAMAGATPGLARTTIRDPITKTPLSRTEIARWFTFLDEIKFEKTGEAAVINGGGALVVDRPGTYTFAYVLRRPISKAEPAEISVVVYANRPLNPTDGEGTFTSLGFKGQTTFNLKYTGTRPNVRRGTWIMDVTFPNPLIKGQYGTVPGQAYLVESVLEVGTDTLQLQVASPLKNDIRTVVVMDNVIAVVERGTIGKF